MWWQFSSGEDSQAGKTERMLKEPYQDKLSFSKGVQTVTKYGDWKQTNGPLKAP